MTSKEWNISFSLGKNFVVYQTYENHQNWNLTNNNTFAVRCIHWVTRVHVSGNKVISKYLHTNEKFRIIKKIINYRMLGNYACMYLKTFLIYTVSPS